MKSQRKLLIVMLILLAKFTFAQKETKFYWNKKWESVTKKENPSYYSLITLGDNDVPVSEMKTYYISGEIFSKANVIKFDKNKFQNCLYKGVLKCFYKNGKMLSEDEYTNEGIIIGISKSYYENGNIKSQVEFTEEGKMNSYMFFYENGNFYETKKFQNGILNGLSKMYYEDGIVSKEVNYLNGKFHGEGKFYYKNGNVSVLQNFDNGKSIDAIYYFENGKKKSITNYTNEMKNGINQEFYENGKLKTEANYLNGKLHGKFVEYDENGNKKSEKNYDNGNIEYRTDGVYVVDVKNALDIDNTNTYIGINNNGKHLIAVKFENNDKYTIFSSFTKSNKLLAENNIYWSNEDDVIYCIKNYIKNSDKIKNWFELAKISNTQKLDNLFDVNVNNARTKGFERYSNLYYQSTITVNPWCTYLISLFRLLDGKVYYKGLYSAYTTHRAEDDKPYVENSSSENELKFLEIPELSNESIKLQKEKELALLQAKQEEEKKQYQLKKEEEAKQAILFEENRKAKLKNLQVGDRVCWSQGWKYTDKFLGITFSENNYNMNVICYIENVSSDRYQIRVASIKSSSNNNWSYPELNGVQLKEGTLHWIKPTDYINNQSWHYME